MSSISTDWSIQSMWIKLDLPIFIDLSIVIDWLFREIYAIIVRWRSVKTTEQTSVWPFLFCFPRSGFYIVSWSAVQKLINCKVLIGLDTATENNTGRRYESSSVSSLHFKRRSFKKNNKLKERRYDKDLFAKAIGTIIRFRSAKNILRG